LRLASSSYNTVDMNDAKQQRWEKLAALVNDGAATEPEKATARKILCSLDASMHRTHGNVVLGIDQNWEIALLGEICQQGGVQLSLGEKGAVLRGSLDRVEAALEAYCMKQPQLEHVIALAAAGWLGRHFPNERGTGGGSTLSQQDIDLARAAARVEGTLIPPGRKLLKD